MKKRRKFFRWLIICLVLFFLFGNHGFRNLFRGYFRLKKLEKELSRISEENQELRKQLYFLENDPSLIEKIARAKLNFVKEGEIIYHFLPKKEK